MKLLIIVPGPLYPVTGMSQVRVINQIKRLAQDHEVFFTDILTRDSQMEQCGRELGPFLKAYLPVLYSPYRKMRLLRAAKYAISRLRWFLSSYSIEEITLSTAFIRKQLLRITRENKFEAVMIHYWYLGYLFPKLNYIKIKMIDTHYLVEENLENLDLYRQSALLKWRMKHELRHSLQMQHNYFRKSNLIIVNSARQKQILFEQAPGLKVELTINGQDLDEYIRYAQQPEKNSVLFYGALSNQFNRLGLKRLLAEIYPLMKIQVPGIKIYIVGSKPPMELINQYKDENVIVKGYVEDIKPAVAKCCVMILPLETSSGFRGRAVEVMALGVPVVGTHNALQSLGIREGIEGFIADSSVDIATKALDILSNDKLRQTMSDACRKFAREHFSIEATFGKLSERLKDMDAGAV